MPAEFLSSNREASLFPSGIEDLYVLEQNVVNDDFRSTPVFSDTHTNFHDPSLYPVGLPSSSATIFPNYNSMNENGLLNLMTMDNEALLQTHNSKSQRNSSNVRSPSSNQDDPISTPTTNRRNHRNRQIFACMDAERKNRTFSDQACLARHLREKHGSKMHYCPIPTCNGSRKGFARKSNLLAHKKRCHPNAFSKSFPDSFLNPPDESADNELSASAVLEEGRARGDDRLGRKLKALRELRDELIGDHQADLENLDREIGILEGAWTIMRDDGDGDGNGGGRLDA
ncbi:hypothetical protein IFR05_002048 [Cadophora sp. M221]|nr:hypothetical protein IFR05_002048 [Cadophora sp. M221]